MAEWENSPAQVQEWAFKTQIMNKMYSRSHTKGW